MTDSQTTRRINRLNLSAGVASTIVALILVLIKFWALNQTQSLSIAASLTDSALDLMVSITALAAIWYAAIPADEEHRFGHTAAEDLAALGQSLFIIGSAIFICITAVKRLAEDKPVPIEAHEQGILIMAISSVITISLVLWQRRVAKTTGSAIVRADSLHYIGDLIPNLGAIFSLLVANWFQVEQVDSLFAIFAAGFLMVNAAKIFKSAWDGLMDHALEPEQLALIAEITGNHPNIHGFHDLKTRRSGSTIFINLHIELDGTQSLNDAHAIGASLRRRLLDTFPNADIMIHKDPVS